VRHDRDEQQTASYLTLLRPILAEAEARILASGQNVVSAREVVLALLSRAEIRRTLGVDDATVPEIEEESLDRAPQPAGGSLSLLIGKASVLRMDSDIQDCLMLGADHEESLSAAAGRLLGCLLVKNPSIKKELIALGASPSAIEEIIRASDQP
jgi:hypothetical protein